MGVVEKKDDQPVQDMADMRKKLKISIEELEKLAHDLAPTRDKRSDAVGTLDEFWILVINKAQTDRSASMSSTESDKSEKTESRE